MNMVAVTCHCHSSYHLDWKETRLNWHSTKMCRKDIMHACPKWCRQGKQGTRQHRKTKKYCWSCGESGFQENYTCPCIGGYIPWLRLFLGLSIRTINFHCCARISPSRQSHMASRINNRVHRHHHQQFCQRVRHSRIKLTKVLPFSTQQPWWR
jgi:hypothetical protein